MDAPEIDAQEPAPNAPPQRRPLRFVVPVVMVWLVGLVGATQGCNAIDVLRHGEAILDGKAAQERAFFSAILQFPKVSAPLCAAELLLGALLTFAASRTLFGREPGRQLLVQASAVYGIFLPIEHVLRRPIHAFLIDTLSTDPAFLAQLGGSVGRADAAEAWWWLFRLLLIAQMLILLLVLVVITRPSVRAWFAEQARVEARRAGD